MEQKRDLKVTRYWHLELDLGDCALVYWIYSLVMDNWLKKRCSQDMAVWSLGKSAVKNKWEHVCIYAQNVIKKYVHNEIHLPNPRLKQTYDSVNESLCHT